ncbi:MAG: hypothetical protein GTN38_03465 [Candidatus Aenigmarchaeota archaeon]|nr:hypothetical protein [Candidatus Aenigmarchaeota archaeon]NIP40719.1 hypothetical protein [Candidatus Aenigmarchaeota archaeon]NIQ18525.1 hypothetical protein [Candidatus Aenigmarchaeota archaeon]NIS73424.1 hypothetical protein [Candidatus Aenigmarchaeota archaeon]
MKKGQVWSLDFVTSLVIFTLVLIPLLFVWNYVNIQNMEQRTFDEIETLALSISDSLIRTKGVPENWNSSNVNVIGLAEGENVLSIPKVSEFLYMGNNEYDLTKNILVGRYDFFFSITDLNGTVYGTAGSKPADRTIVPVERYCLYNNRVVKIELALIG